MIDQPVAVVTGSSRGVGRGIAEHFLREGYRVAGCSRGPSSLENEGYEHTIVDAGIDEQIRGIGRPYGRIDVVVNNAGVGPAALTLTTSTKLVESTLRTNFMGAFSVCRESAQVMLLRRFGRIVNISSIAVGLHMKGAPAYVASKGALEEFSKVLAKELGPSGITCNVVAISLAESDMSSNLNEEARNYYNENLAIQPVAT